MLKVPAVMWGSDPEAFFQRDGDIIGSERLIPKRGLAAKGSRVVRDGVQFELNPKASRTIQGLGQNIGACLQKLQDTLDINPGVSINYNGLVEVTRRELDSLSPDTRRLGCMPSHNFYGVKPIDVDPLLYRKRSSGGHVHMGLSYPIYSQYDGSVNDNRTRLVPLCDIFVGALAVLLDRDPGAAERRENYGRAGEHRLPNHGLEYRTTSNFWLRDYVLMSFVFGMTSVAISVLEETLFGRNNLEQELVDTVDIGKVQRAIDLNDFDLAMENFERIKPFLARHLPDTGFPLAPSTLDKFETFATNIRINGLKPYFPTKDIINRWQGPYVSFESFLRG